MSAVMDAFDAVGLNGAALLMLAALVLATVVAWRRRARPAAAWCGVSAVIPAVSLVQTSHPLALVVLAVVAVLPLWWQHGRTMATVTRWGARSRRKAGVASTWDVARVGSAVAMRRRAPTVRPSLRPASRRARAAQLLRLPAEAVAVELCRAGAVRAWASIEDVVVVFGGPRVGKSQWLAGRILDAPGAVLATSTRTDLLEQTGPLRARIGPVYVFNPVGLGEIASTITFDPLTGCCDPVTAHERAADMIAAAHHAGAGGDREYWDEQGRRNLAALMHAAALGGLSMDDVSRWLADLDGAKPVIVSLLRNHSPEPGFVAAVTQFIDTNERTRTSITSTISAALSWLIHGPARAAARSLDEGGVRFDVGELLESRATVYLLGGEEAQVAPLVCALTGYIAREARRLAADRPGGRLDPPLSLRLDEAALICPVPLDRWTADMGGRGVSIVACFQSRAQLLDRYGEAKAAVILNNAGARMLFGGTADRDDLGYWSALAGDREEPISTTDRHGHVLSRTTRLVPVLSAAQLANLPDGRVVVFRRGLAPVIGRAEQAWRRFDVRAHRNPRAVTVRLRLAVAAASHRVGASVTAAINVVAGVLRPRWRACARWSRRCGRTVGSWFGVTGRSSTNEVPAGRGAELVWVAQASRPEQIGNGGREPDGGRDLLAQAQPWPTKPGPSGRAGSAN